MIYKTAALALISGLALVGCEQSSEPEPVEEMQDAASDAGEAMEDAADATEDAVEDAVDETEEAVDDATSGG